MKKLLNLSAAAIIFILSAMLISGCGGGGGDFGGIDNPTGGISDVSGTVSDINRSTITGATIWPEDEPGQTAISLASGAYKITRVSSGWQNIRARATINGVQWVGFTAVQVLKDEPTMNINITLSPASQTTSISGYVENDNGNRVRGARVLFTARTVYPEGDTSAYDGSYGSIVALTDINGRYELKNVPVGITAVISASHEGYNNREYSIDTVSSNDIKNFELIPVGDTYMPYKPKLEYIESYTMPNSINVLSGTDSTAKAYKAIKSLTSARFTKAVAGKSVKTKVSATPAGSLIEIDLYWNAFTDNDSRDVAGYGIYRTTDPNDELRAIDFIRDPYANFYGDMGSEITPNQDYYYAITAVDVQYLDSYGDFISGAESDFSNSLSIIPLGQLSISSPSNNAYVSENPTFRWNSLNNADEYRLLVFDRFPAYSVSPIINTTLNGSATSYQYNGTALNSGHTYYWVMLAADTSESAFSYSQIRAMTVQ